MHRPSETSCVGNCPGGTKAHRTLQVLPGCKLIPPAATGSHTVRAGTTPPSVSPMGVTEATCSTERNWEGGEVGTLQEMRSFVAAAPEMLTEGLAAFGETGNAHRLVHPWHS